MLPTYGAGLGRGQVDPQFDALLNSRLSEQRFDAEGHPAPTILNGSPTWAGLSSSPITVFRSMILRPSISQIWVSLVTECQSLLFPYRYSLPFALANEQAPYVIRIEHVLCVGRPVLRRVPQTAIEPSA
jgi:hypothetical protein